MTEVINDYSFSHEFGREEIKVRELDGYVNYDDGSYENPDLINEFFSKHHKELENKILNLYDNLQ